MTKTRRTIAVALFTVLALVGAGWALEKAFTNSYSAGGASRPARAVDAPAVREPAAESVGGQPAAPTFEYDRSDLLLSQG